MTDFASLGLAEPILRAVAGEGYTIPTPIQAGAIPALLGGRDVVGIAQTGTGKTAAFVLPILHHLSERRLPTPPRTCQALILTPTRELACQIGDNLKAYGRFVRLSHTVVVGGVSMGAQVRALSRGVDVLVATPGRLLDHVGEGTLHLQHTHIVVLDEADQMLDLGFLLPIRRILGRLALKRQTILFSATMPPPIRELADEFLREPMEIAVAPAARPIDRIEQSVVPVAAVEKRAKLVEILAPREVESAIVFTRTKRGADRVCEYLEAAGLSAAAIHGNKSQSQRERALAAFKQRRVRILVATDIAARGIDVDGVSHVINYELPNVPESYVHRIGRTARAGATGIAIALVDPEEYPLLRDIEKLIGRTLLDRPEQRGGPRGPKRPQQARPQQRSAAPRSDQARPARTGDASRPARTGESAPRPARGPHPAAAKSAGQPQQARAAGQPPSRRGSNSR
ncbi:MAG: DEAD/DEAH box helicase [Alphaproteobacteria bacterium]|nr:DEAD/DEAH box helicase [Alphaproteobacteria bacterium]TAD90544.1 MAG: DEAD/DEAH box helicase [Alphaproteobacteria bacterium]